jgi:opacity protein-like surface antigen
LILRSVLAVTLLGASLAFAQSTPTEAPGSGFSEIERGVFLGVYGGASFVTNPPADENGKRPFSAGQTVGVELGYELGSRLAVSLFVTGSVQREGSDYIGKSGGAASGDFSLLTPGAALRLSAVGFADDQGVKRTWLYLRGGVGYVMFTPKALLPDSDFLVFAGPGLEYYTRLRHFSIGVELVGTMLAKSKAFGFSLTPTLRYAF